MKLDINKQYSGFVIRQAAYIDEIQSEAYVMEHTYSGARLLYLGNNDDNKVFSISFRTPPYDDTGVAHILEHSVLCGSRKYRLKEPFVELVKGSGCQPQRQRFSKSDGCLSGRCFLSADL